MISKLTGQRQHRPTAAAALVAGLVGASVLLGTPALAEDPPAPKEAFTIGDERITESSGLTVGTKHPDLFYTMNDSGGEAMVFGLDGSGAVVATVSLGEVTPEDWEAISTGPEGRIWVGDIGDNDSARETITLYRFREPEELGDTSEQWSRYPFAYEDGPHDAEAILVHPETGQIYVVTKSPDGGGIYAAPEEPVPGETGTLTKVGDAPPVVTDGAFLPDGSGAVLRTYDKAYVIELPSGKVTRTVGLPRQKQGESIAVSPDGKQFFAGSEGAGSAVYTVSSTAPPPPKPSATATKDPAGENAGDEGAGEGTEAGSGSGVKGLLGGIPWWIPALVLGAALLAGIVAFPRARRRPVAPGGVRDRQAPVSHDLDEFDDVARADRLRYADDPREAPWAAEDDGVPGRWPDDDRAPAWRDEADGPPWRDDDREPVPSWEAPDDRPGRWGDHGDGPPAAAPWPPDQAGAGAVAGAVAGPEPDPSWSAGGQQGNDLQDYPDQPPGFRDMPAYADYSDQPPAYNDPPPGFQDAPPAYADQPAGRHDQPPGYRDVPAYSEPPAYGDRPPYGEPPAHGDNAPAYSDPPGGFRDQPAYADSPPVPGYQDQPPAYADPPTPYGGQSPAYNDPPPGYQDTPPAYADPPPFQSDSPGYQDASPYQDPSRYQDASPFQDPSRYQDGSPGQQDQQPAYVDQPTAAYARDSIPAPPAWEDGGWHSPPRPDNDMSWDNGPAPSGQPGSQASPPGWDPAPEPSLPWRQSSALPWEQGPPQGGRPRDDGPSDAGPPPWAEPQRPDTPWGEDPAEAASRRPSWRDDYRKPPTPRRLFRDDDPAE
ncbi:hypothetical protein ABN028_00460 [Actinopolymorpha sp. B17G11]|uniref:YncE family protein n=1 Tax=Actinopolymorpha sp. B17G11 TaxID=3160861 RepID=UPI0032E3CC27